MACLHHPLQVGSVPAWMHPHVLRDTKTELLEHLKEKIKKKRPQRKQTVFGLQGVKLTRGNFYLGSSQNKCGRTDAGSSPILREGWWVIPAEGKGKETGWRWDVCSPREGYSWADHLCCLHHVGNILHLEGMSWSSLIWAPLSPAPVPVPQPSLHVLDLSPAALGRCDPISSVWVGRWRNATLDAVKTWHWAGTTCKNPGRDLRHSKTWEDRCESLIQHKFYHFLEYTDKSGILCACVFMDMTERETGGKHMMIIIAASFSLHLLK